MGIDILGIDIMGVDILGIDIPAPTPKNILKLKKHLLLHFMLFSYSFLCIVFSGNP